MSHREPPPHPLERDINLDWTRSDLKQKLDQLNPILQDILNILSNYPVSADEDQKDTAAAGGYHNVTFCSHS